MIDSNLLVLKTSPFDQYQAVAVNNGQGFAQYRPIVPDPNQTFYWDLSLGMGKIAGENRWRHRVITCEHFRRPNQTYNQGSVFACLR